MSGWWHQIASTVASEFSDVPDLAQATRIVLRLGMAGGIEGYIHLPLEAQFAVPVGFSVAQQDEFGHACIIDRLIPRQWPHGSSRAGTNTPPHR